MLVLALVVFAVADMMKVVVVARVEVVRVHSIGSHELFRRKCWVVATAVAVATTSAATSSITAAAPSAPSSHTKPCP